MSLDSVVSLQITLQSSAPTKAGFGRPLILGYHNKFADLTRLYKNPSELLADGFTPQDAVYQAAVALKSQRPSVKDFKVGKLTANFTQVVDLTPVNVTEGHTYSGTLSAYSTTGALRTAAWFYTNGATETLDTVNDAIATAINTASTAQGLGVTAVSTPVGAAGTHVVCTSTAGVEVLWSGLVGFTGVGASVKETSLVSVTSGMLDAIYNYDKDWYGAVLAFESATDILVVAPWLETKRRLFVATSPNSDIVTSATTDLGSTLKTADYFRTGLFYHPDPGVKMSAAILSQRLTSVPGSDTWAHKSVVGPRTYSLTAAEEGFAKAKNVNTYTEIAGNGNTLWGTVAGGEYFDIVRGIDHLYAHIQENVVGVFQAMPKVPYTNAGAAIMQSTIQATLDKHAKAPINFLSNEPDDKPLCEVPDVKTVSATDRANRLLPDVTFSGRVQGAIHAVEIAGTLAV